MCADFDSTGYDVVNINSDNFNDTRGFSWYERWRMGSDGCQAHMFQLGDTFQTNTSAVRLTLSVSHVIK